MKHLSSKWLMVALFAGVLPFNVACQKTSGGSSSSTANCTETVAQAFGLSSQSMSVSSLARNVSIQSAVRDAQNRVLAVNLSDRQYGYGQFYVTFENGPAYNATGFVTEYRNYDVSYRCLDGGCNQIAVLVEDYGQNGANPMGAVMKVSSGNNYVTSCVTGS